MKAIRGGIAAVDLPSMEKKGLPLDGLRNEHGNVHFALAGKVTLNGKEGKFAFRRTLSDDPQRHQSLLGAYQFPDQRVVVLSERGDFPQMFYPRMMQWLRERDS